MGRHVDGGLLDADRAQALAETLHRGQRDAGGAPLIDHVRRVAAAVPGEARVVAWLHELLEHTPISEADLLMEGLTTAELRALRLLTRDTGLAVKRDLSGPHRAARTGKRAGAGVAQSVKRADLIDRARHPSIRPDGWSPPYELGLEVLERAAPRPSCPQSSRRVQHAHRAGRHGDAKPRAPRSEAARDAQGRARPTGSRRRVSRPATRLRAAGSRRRSRQRAPEGRRAAPERRRADIAARGSCSATQGRDQAAAGGSCWGPALRGRAGTASSGGDTRSASKRS